MNTSAGRIPRGCAVNSHKMVTMGTMPQESRTERITIAVTPAEKKLVDLVVQVGPIGTVSELLRERSFADVVAQGQRLLDKLREASADDLEPTEHVA